MEYCVNVPPRVEAFTKRVTENGVNNNLLINCGWLKFTLQKNLLKVYNIAVNNLDMHRNKKKQT